jgi:tRNA pseudouridine55 synthase
VGDIEQVPTAVSAIKVDGKRAYERVRAGEDVQLKARPVTIHSIDVTAVRPGEQAFEVDISVRCTSGTYIRAIARDLGAALGVGGHLTMLRRTAVGEFDLATASTLEQLDEEFRVVPIADAARATFPAVELSEEQERDVRVGRRLGLEITGTVAVFAPSGEFLALYEPHDGGAKPLAVFVG